LIQERIRALTNIIQLSDCNLTISPSISEGEIELNFQSCSVTIDSVLTWGVKLDSGKMVN
jgi:hypothetical protein